MPEPTVESDTVPRHWQHLTVALMGDMDEHGAWICPVCLPSRRSDPSMAKFKTETRGFIEPDEGTSVKFLYDEAKRLGVPEDARVDCDGGDWSFYWTVQMTPEDEEAERLAKIEEQRLIDEEEAEDREAGF